MNATQLDNQITAADAYTKALEDGKTENEAEEIARAAVKRKNAGRVLQRVGIHGEELEKALDNMGY